LAGDDGTTGSGTISAPRGRSGSTIGGASGCRKRATVREVVDDHKTMDRKLMAYVEKKGLSSQLEQTATTADTTTRSDADMHSRLQGETGSEFDRDFANTMVEEHDKAIQMVKGARDSVTDSQLRAMLDEALPKLEKHRKMAQDLIDKKLKS
jgi:putative membrane protein